MCVVPLSRICRRFSYIPTNDELESVLESYKEQWGFPMCAGAIDGTHIPIIAPKENKIDYVNRKGYHSVVMQAVVDCNYLFRDIVIGWPGSVRHDARILSNSKLYKKAETTRDYFQIQGNVSVAKMFLSSYLVTLLILCYHGF